MLLATASYALPCHASNKRSNSSSTTNNSKSQKLTRNTNQASQQKSSNTKTAAATVVTKTTAALMKTIVVRSGGFQNDANASVQKTTQQHRQQQQINNNKTNLCNINEQLKKANTNSTNATTTNIFGITKHTTQSKSNTNNTNGNGKSAASNTTATASLGSSNTSSSLVALKTTIPTASFLKTYTVPPTGLHRSSNARLRSCSIDSLHDEMCHFKPIRLFPLTPIKSGSHSRGFSLKAPKPKLGKRSENCDFTAIKRVIDRENQRAKIKPIRRNKTRLSSSILQTIKPHLSAFVRLQPNAFNDFQLLSTGSTSPVHLKCKQKLTKKTQKSTKRSTKTTKSQKSVQPRGKQQKESAVKVTEIKKAVKVSTNTRKRKAQTTEPKQNQKEIKTKKPRKTTDKTKNTNANINRKTPPLTRGRIRLSGNAKLVGPLV